jgi:serine/threonine protein kinase
MAEDLGHTAGASPSLDLRRTVDHVPTTDAPSTVDDSGAYQPVGLTGPYIPAPPADAPSVPGYRITAEIAHGGMGRVYAAVDLTLDREVAIKTLLAGASAERFLTEAKMTARLPHPNIPPVHALGKLADDTPYLAMKLIRGRTLAELLEERPSPLAELPRFVQIFEQIAQGVGFAHAQGIIHRDLKPLNVMVGAFGEVQVMDWGLAKEVGSGERERPEERHEEENVTHTAAGAVLGTPGYMAPEQARGEAAGARVDVFALGAMLAAILTGQPAFVGTSKREVIERTGRADLADVRERLTNSGADVELIALALRCLSANVAERPVDGHAVAAEVAAYRAGVEARLKQAETERAEAVVREAEHRKRRRTVQVAGGIIAVVLLAGLSVSLWQMLRAMEAKAEANTKAQQARDERDAKERALKAEEKARQAEGRALQDEIAQRELSKKNERSATFAALAEKNAKEREAEARLQAEIKARKARLDLLEAYTRAGENAKFANVLREERQALPKGSPQLAQLLASTSLILMQHKKYAEAEPLLRECLAIRARTQPDAWTTFNTQSTLGGALLAQMKYAEAEPLLLKGYEGMKAREKTMPQHGGAELRIPEALDRLIELYTALNKPDEVKKWRAERAQYPQVKTTSPEKK